VLLHISSSVYERRQIFGQPQLPALNYSWRETGWGGLTRLWKES
jgi:hypothetical protein